jgi:hypothetical protein
MQVDAVSRDINPDDDRCSIFENCAEKDEHPLQRSYRSLRNRRVAEYGWIDLRDSARDHDVYDEIGARTLTVLLHSASGHLKAGARLTMADGRSAASSLSAQMWPSDVSDKISEDRELSKYFEAGDLVDCTRLLLADGAGPSDSVELIGACVAATDGLLGTYMTVERMFVDFFAICDVPTDIVYEGLLDDAQSAFIIIRPPKEFSIGDMRTRQSLSRGALLVDPFIATGLPFFSAPDIDLRNSDNSQGSVVTMAKLMER